jgi:hypothetical protein
MPRNTAFFMHQRAVQIVQQRRGDGAASGPPFSFTDPSFNTGNVFAIIDDGAGGKFVGGSFTSVTCNVTSTTYTTGYERLVHLLPTGEVDAAWSCPVGSVQVNALALDVANGVLYVGGSYSTIGGQTRADLAAVDAATGVVVSGWTCNVVGSLQALALDVANDRLYVGGQFTNIAGASPAKVNLAAVTASTGVVDAAWQCNTNGIVYRLEVDAANDRLYVGGNYSTIGGVSKGDLAAVTASTGVVVSGWTCSTSGVAYVFALALDVANDRLYVGGDFTIIGGVSKTDLAAVTASTGVVVSGFTCNTASGWINVLAVDGLNDRLYIGGTFSNIGGASPAKLRFAAATASTGAVDAAWQCDAGSNVLALSLDVANNALFVGGSFSGATGLDGQQRDRFGTVVASTGDLFVP